MSEMFAIERTQSQTYYRPEPPLKPKLKQTRSCPTRTKRSESHFRSNSSNLPKLPPNFRNGSIGGVTSLSSKDIEMSAIESSTSSSPLHGIILVSIMLSSLIAFVCSKIRRPCDHFDPNAYEHSCQMPVLLFFSVTTIISCLISFVIYFLHLIGQCDVKWIVNKKVTIEMVTISVIVTLLIVASILMLSKTKVLDYSIGIMSIICSSLSVIGYAIRITKLFSEAKKCAKRGDQSLEEPQIDETALTVMKERLKSRLNADSSKSWELSANSTENSGTALRVVSYVKRKKSLDSNPKSVSHTNDPNGFDLDIDDDVFIN